VRNTGINGTTSPSSPFLFFSLHNSLPHGNSGRDADGARGCLNSRIKI
jgi:hypothetical protein